MRVETAIRKEPKSGFLRWLKCSYIPGMGGAFVGKPQRDNVNRLVVAN